MEVDTFDKSNGKFSDNTEYKSMFKSMGLFGGVEVVKILAGVFLSKIVAVLLGPGGMGMREMFMSINNIFCSIFGLGLRTSAVKEIATIGLGNEKEYYIISVIKKLLLFLGILGMLLMVLMSKWLSIWTFGNDNHFFAIILLSASVLFTILNSGQLAILQGLRLYNKLAKATIIGTLFGVIVSGILLYIYSEKGIVLSIVVISFSLYLIYYLYSFKYIQVRNSLSIKESFVAGKNIILMGLALMIGSFVMVVFSYILNISIQRIGNISDVGFYKAGYLISTYYIGIVFSAMAADYLPRLSAIKKKNQLLETIEKQTEICILIVTPLTVSLITLMPIIIILLYSKEFIGITNFVSFAILGMIFKAISWCLSYALIAQGFAKLFLLLEVSSGIIILFINVIGYYYYGLNGLGFSYSIGYLLYLIMHVIAGKKKYQLRFTKKIKRLFLWSNLSVLLVFIIYLKVGHPNMYMWGSLYTLIVCYVCFRSLNKRIQFVNLLKNKINNESK